MGLQQYQAVPEVGPEGKSSDKGTLSVHARNFIALTAVGAWSFAKKKAHQLVKQTLKNYHFFFRWG
jgi:hypothetical protein